MSFGNYFLVYTIWYITEAGEKMSIRLTKVFMNGRSQAVRVPKDCRFDCAEVYVRKQGDGILITPAQPSWDDFFDQESAFGDDYLAGREDVPAQPRNF